MGNTKGRKPQGRANKTQFRPQRKWRPLYAAFLAVFAAVAIFAAANIAANLSEKAAARRDYAELRKYSPDSFDLSDINPDYIGWIQINGTAVDYPVVQGQDNSKYINVGFKGDLNLSGAIFMDYRCGDGFDGDFAILYGHNMRDDSMFADLHNYRRSGYLAANPDITIITPEGETLTYRIFAARLTDSSNDQVFALCNQSRFAVERYFAGYDVPEGAERFLVLSTCTSNQGDDERLVVFAALTA